MEIVRLHCDCEHQGGWGLEWSGMVNRCKSLINVVSNAKPKMLKTSQGSQA